MKPFRRQDCVHPLYSVGAPCFECRKSLANEMDVPVVVVFDESPIGSVKVAIKATKATLSNRVEVLEICVSHYTTSFQGQAWPKMSQKE